MTITRHSVIFTYCTFSPPRWLDPVQLAQLICIFFCLSVTLSKVVCQPACDFLLHRQSLSVCYTLKSASQVSIQFGLALTNIKVDSLPTLSHTKRGLGGGVHPPTIMCESKYVLGLDLDLSLIFIENGFYFTMSFKRAGFDLTWCKGTRTWTWLGFENCWTCTSLPTKHFWYNNDKGVTTHFRVTWHNSISRLLHKWRGKSPADFGRVWQLKKEDYTRIWSGEGDGSQSYYRTSLFGCCRKWMHELGHRKSCIGWLWEIVAQAGSWKMEYWWCL